MIAVSAFALFKFFCGFCELAPMSSHTNIFIAQPKITILPRAFFAAIGIPVILLRPSTHVRPPGLIGGRSIVPDCGGHKSIENNRAPLVNRIWRPSSTEADHGTEVIRAAVSCTESQPPVGLSGPHHRHFSRGQRCRTCTGTKAFGNRTTIGPMAAKSGAQLGAEARPTGLDRSSRVCIVFFLHPAYWK